MDARMIRMELLSPQGFVAYLKQALKRRKKIHLLGKIYTYDSQSIQEILAELDEIIFNSSFHFQISHVTDQEVYIRAQTYPATMECLFCGKELPPIHDLGQGYDCSCGATYWTEDALEANPSKYEYAEELGLAFDNFEFRQVNFDIIKDWPEQPDEEGEPWVLIFAKRKE